MIAALREWTDWFLGRGEAATTVPPFDGALKPNRLLEDAEQLLTLDAPDDLASDGRAVFASDGPRLLRLDGNAASEIARFERPITALACLADGGFALAVGGTELRIVGGGLDGKSWGAVAGAPLVAANAISVTDSGKLLITDGSNRQPSENWCHDLMELGHSGRLLELDAATGESRELARNLAYAYGACQAGTGVWVSESWRHRVRQIGGGATSVIDRLPAYPSRITRASDGGFWLTAFAARTQLVEFILREPAYRKRMMAEIEPQYWVAPALTSGNTYLEPMQGAHIKTMGILKPWAPPRSYGLVIRLGADGLPLYSLHSRVDGKNHGVTAAVECQGALYVLAKGPKRILRLPIAEAERSLQP